MPPTPVQLEQRLIILEGMLALLVKSDRYVFQRDIQLLDGRNIQLATGTGTKIGTAADQKLGLWGATPVIQYQPTGVTSGFTNVGTGTEITEADTFSGNVGSQVYTIGDLVAALKKSGILLS